MNYGTDIHKEIPPTLYIRTRARISPISKKNKATLKEIESLKNNLQNCLQKTITENPHFENRFLTNIDLSVKNCAEGKRTFFKYDVFVRPQKPNNINVLEPSVKNLSLTIERRLLLLLNKAGFQYDMDLKCS